MRFCFCFWLAARNNLFSFASKRALYNLRRNPLASWFDGDLTGLVGSEILYEVNFSLIKLVDEVAPLYNKRGFWYKFPA